MDMKKPLSWTKFSYNVQTRWMDQLNTRRALNTVRYSKKYSISAHHECISGRTGLAMHKVGLEVIFTSSAALPLGGKGPPPYLLKVRLDGPHSLSQHFRREEISFLPGMEPRCLGRPASNLVTAQTRLPRLRI